MSTYDSGELKQFVQEMERAIKAVGAPSVRKREDFLKFQENQYNNIVSLETKFRDDVLSRGLGPAVYGAFIGYVRTLPSVMSARSYFRERQDAFADTLGPAVDTGDWEHLARYAINQRFVAWALTTGLLPAPFRTLARKIRRQRDEMITLLMPLGISRARMFRRRTPPSHLGLQDQVQGAFEGLICGVDKFAGPFSSIYRGVAVGRVVGELIEMYSETMLHFYPNDRRVLYRANKIHGKVDKGMGTTDFEAMATQLNQDAAGVFVTDAHEVAGLMAASSHVSSDAVMGARRAVARMVAPEEQSPDHVVEVAEGVEAVRAAARNLPLVQRKLLVLAGMLSVEEVVS